ACLTLEWAARDARRYGAVVGLSGGLIGPDGTPRDYPGTFDATRLFLGCSDVDPHIAMHRVVEAGEVFNRMGADVAIRFYPGMAHTVSVEELDQVLALVESICLRARGFLLVLFAHPTVLDDAPGLEEEGRQAGARFGLRAGQEFEGHAE